MSASAFVGVCARMDKEQAQQHNFFVNLKTFLFLLCVYVMYVYLPFFFNFLYFLMSLQCSIFLFVFFFSFFFLFLSGTSLFHRHFSPPTEGHFFFFLVSLFYLPSTIYAASTFSAKLPLYISFAKIVIVIVFSGVPYK